MKFKKFIMIIETLKTSDFYVDALMLRDIFNMKAEKKKKNSCF